MQDPTLHVYLFYDLVYHQDLTEVYLNYVDNKILGYLLIWKGFKCWGIHIIGKVNDEILQYLPNHKCLYIHLLPSDVDVLSKVYRRYSSTYKVKVLNFLDMVVTKNTFRPYHKQDMAIRLTLDHLDKLYEVKKIQGVDIPKQELLMRLISPHWHYYGVLINGELVSIATAYLKLPEVWVIGDVFTRPEYRGRGYAKAVTSAVTRDAINAGAIALLHVDENNLPAIKVYQSLGYRTIRVKKWYLVEG